MSKTSKSIPLIGAFGGLTLLLLIGFQDIKFSLDVNYIWAFMGITIPTSAGYAVLKKLGKA